MSPEIQKAKEKTERLLDQTLEIHELMDRMLSGGVIREAIVAQRMKLTSAAEQAEAALQELLDLGYDEEAHGQLVVSNKDYKLRLEKYEV